jgi:phosphatidylinositol alpha-mannosyltransferase
MSQVKMRAIEPKTPWQKLRFGFFKVFALIYQVLIGLYVAYVLLANRIWKIADARRKRLRTHKSSGRLKVAVVSEFYYPHMGGLSGDVHYACVEFARKGYDVALITSNVAAPHNIQYSEHGFRIIRIGKSLPVWANGSLAKVSFDLRIGTKVKEMIESEKFDVIHVHCPMTPILPLLVQRYADCPVVGHLHAMLLSKPLLFKIFHRFTKSVMDDFDGLVSVSDTAAKPFQDWFGSKFITIPNGIPVDEFLDPKVEKIEKYDDGKINVFWIGRLEPRNGLSLMIDAFRIFHREFPNSRLIIAGDGPLRPYFEDEVELDLKPHVHFLGAILKEKPAYFKTTHINVVPTNRIASLGVAMLEAMVSGAPTVASDLPAFRETYTSEVDVLTAHPDHPEQFAAQMLRLARDPELSARLAENARKKMIERFSWTSIIDRVDRYTLPILESLNRESTAGSKQDRRYVA